MKQEYKYKYRKKFLKIITFNDFLKKNMYNSNETYNIKHIYIIILNNHKNLLKSKRSS